MGQAACLVTALIWAISLSLFRGPIEQYGARTINLAKCLIGAALQGLTVVVLGQTGALGAASGRGLVLLVASGLVGLVLGDTALFTAVARIGVQRTLLLQTLTPVFTVAIVALGQGERPTGLQAAGAAIILSGVALVVAPGPARTPPGLDARAARRHSWTPGGVAAAVLAALGQASGIVLAKAGMVEIPVVSASFLRLAAAAIGLALVGALAGRLGRLPELARSRPTLARVVPGAVFGTYLSLFLMMAGIALAPAPIAAVLLATSPVFGLALEALLGRAPITVRGLAGTLLAVGGVAVLGAG